MKISYKIVLCMYLNHCFLWFYDLSVTALDNKTADNSTGLKTIVHKL